MQDLRPSYCHCLRPQPYLIEYLLFVEIPPFRLIGYSIRDLLSAVSQRLSLQWLRWHWLRLRREVSSESLPLRQKDDIVKVQYYKHRANVFLARYPIWVIAVSVFNSRKDLLQARNAPSRGLWVPWAGSLWHKSAGGAIPRIKPRYWMEKTTDELSSKNSE